MKQARTKTVCVHLHVLYATLNTSNVIQPCQRDVPPPVPDHVPVPEEENATVSRLSTLQLAEMEAQFPYDVARHTLQKIMQQDACSLCGVPGGWAEKFSPAEMKCRLCQGDLGNEESGILDSVVQCICYRS